MDFGLTAVNVLLLVVMAIPGYILIKAKVVKQDAIKYFAKVLLYVNQPFLTLNSFLSTAYTPSILKNLGIAVALSFGVQLFLIAVLVLFYFKSYNRLAPKKVSGFLQTNVEDFAFSNSEEKVMKGKGMRVLTTCSVFGNVGFLGIPVVKALLPSYPEAITYTAVFIVAMNLLCWTVGAYIITGDRKYVSIKRAILNPPTLTLVIALPLFFTGVKLPAAAMKGIGLLADMTTPMCMLILGMRFGAAPFKELFMNGYVYISALTKIVVLPLVMFTVCYFLPIDRTLKITLFILSAMPCASVNLNLSEIFNGNKKVAANTILLSTLFCVVTIPVLMLMTKFL